MKAQWEPYEIDRGAYPKREADDFEFHLFSMDYNMGICSDCELIPDEAEVLLSHYGKQPQNGCWLEVFRDKDDPAAFVCGLHEGDPRNFERIRRITGYLVGTLDRFNNGKAAEERDRVKHEV